MFMDLLLVRHKCLGTVGHLSTWIRKNLLFLGHPTILVLYFSVMAIRVITVVTDHSPVVEKPCVKQLTTADHVQNMHITQTVHVYLNLGIKK